MLDSVTCLSARGGRSGLATAAEAKNASPFGEATCQCAVGRFKLLWDPDGPTIGWDGGGRLEHTGQREFIQHPLTL